MPKLLNTTTEQLNTVSNFGFSAQRPDTLGASEYTIVGIAVDVSGSVSGFRNDLAKAYKDVIGACRKNPRAENLLTRGVQFNEALSEIHGFVTLDNVDENKVMFDPRGGTALFDSTLELVETTATYGKTLTDMDFLVNAVLFVITDGDDTSSRFASPAKIKAALEKVRQSETLESIKVVLIGVGNSAQVQRFLDDLHQQAGLDQFVWVGNADAKSLAKMADFVSRSISSSSQSLGTGGPSQNLSI